MMTGRKSRTGETRRSHGGHTQLTSLILAALFFVSIHVLVAGTRARDRFVARMGENAYLAFFSLLSIAGLTWLCWAYASAPTIWLAAPAAWTRPLAWALVFLAFLLVVVGVTTPSPTSTGGDEQLDASEPATGILRITRHPFLWGVALWAAAHLIANPDAASLVLFASLLVLALVGPPSIDAKRGRRFGDRWQRFAEATSSVPFAAILGGRNHLALSEIGLLRPAAAVALYAVFFWAHPWLFGVPAGS